MLLLAYVAIFLALVLYFYKQFQKAVTTIPNLPGPTPVPFLGNIPHIAGKPSIWISAIEWLLQYGDIIQLFFFTRRLVIIGANEQAVKDLYSNKVFIKGILSKDLEDVVGKTGMVFSDGDVWSKARKTCAGAFNIQHLKIFESPIRTVSENLNTLLSSRISKERQIKAIDMDDVFVRATLDVVGRTMFSLDFQSFMTDSPISEAIANYMKIAFAQIVNPLHLFNPWFIFKRKKNCKYILSFVENIIQMRVNERASSSSESSEVRDLLDLLLDAESPDTGIGLTADEIRDQVTTFLVAGHETTAHSLAFTISCLAQYPHISQKVYEEVDEVFSQASNEKIGYEDTSKLTYLTAVIKETMRMFPVVPAVLRQLEDDHNVCGFNLPKGTLVGVDIMALHYSHQNWKNPTEFNPSRFLSSSESEAHVSSFIFAPFGHGRRSCLGQHFAMMEMKLMLAYLLRQFRFELYPLYSVSLIQHLTLRPSGGLKVTVWPRS